MHRDEHVPWRMVGLQPWKRALEKHVQSSHEKALANGMPSDVQQDRGTFGGHLNKRMIVFVFFQLSSMEMDLQWLRQPCRDFLLNQP
ncbi:hypothetical protein TNCV_2632091 [Trichonephila clavipes]|nr:hypothetical protein TNCV_2632091 [Trichonephila clavipes]